MSSFFRMGRQPDTFALVVGFEGYVAASDGVPPRLETHEARVEWESEERAEDVFARLLEAERALPFDTSGQVAVVELVVDEHAASTSGSGSTSPAGTLAQTHGFRRLARIDVQHGEHGNLASFLIGGGASSIAAIATSRKTARVTRTAREATARVEEWRRAE